MERGGPRAFVEFATQDVEVHDPPELPDAQTWRGREAVVGRLEDVVATTGGTWADIDDVRAVGDEVLVSLTWRMERAARRRSRPSITSSGVEGDRIARVRVFLEEDAAVQAAGG